MSTFIGLSSLADTRTNRFAGSVSSSRNSSLNRLRTAMSPRRLGGGKNHSRSPERISYISYASTFAAYPLSATESIDSASSRGDLSSVATSPMDSGSSWAAMDSKRSSMVSSGTHNSSQIRQDLCMRAMCRQPSAFALELQEERRLFGFGDGAAAVDMPMEPRPVEDVMSIGGIFEVLEGRI